MTKNKITDEQLMMFADGELNNKELAMDIVHKVLEDSDEAYDIRKRLNVFVKTRTLLKQIIGKK